MDHRANYTNLMGNEYSSTFFFIGSSFSMDCTV